MNNFFAGFSLKKRIKQGKMDEQMCPRCRTTRYRNPSLKLMVNVCGHSLCENCIEALFVRGSADCVQCGIPLRRTNFRIQIFEDEGVEKEVDIRKKILRDFNMQEEDFPTLRQYNDYLEEVETIIFNLANNIDVDETRRKIEEYKKVNAEKIRKNKSKLSKDNELIENLLEDDKMRNEQRKKQMLEDEVKEKNERKMKKESLIDDLMFSDLPASHIVSTHREAEEREQKQIKVEARERISYSTQGSTFQQIAKQDSEPYTHSPFIMETFGPKPVDLQQLASDGYLNHIRPTTDSELGGGFHIRLAVQRAMQEAMCGIFHGFDSATPSPAISSASSSEIKQEPMTH